MLLYRHGANGTRAGRAVRFFAMNNLLLLARLPILQLLVVNGVGLLVANGITLVMLFLVRFVVSDRAIFASGAQESGPDPVRAPPGDRAQVRAAVQVAREVPQAVPVPDLPL
jgi:hypothetical protein